MIEILKNREVIKIRHGHRGKQLELASRITYIDLSSVPCYMDQYTAALLLPHTDSSLFSTPRSRQV